MKRKILILLALCQILMANIIAQTPATPIMISVQGGSFMMGGKEENAKPVHKVTVSNFSIGKFEVTVPEYRAFCNSTGRAMPPPPSWGWFEDHPIVGAAFPDAVAYCEWLSKTTGKNYRLPTEAEWEYAARGGNKSMNYIFAGSNTLNDVAWDDGNAGGTSHPVGSLKPNELGIYNMSGNVWEWCGDWYAKDYYSQSPSENPKGPSSGSERVLRGGGWNYGGEDCHVDYRDYDSPGYRLADRGFRVVMTE